MLKILLSNDDGVHAEGLAALKEALTGLGEILIVAPKDEQSASSRSLSLRRPLRVDAVRPGVFSVDGTPTDCILLATRGVPGVVQFKPDLIVSGINNGANLGDDVTYSGTVAAAIEGHTLGIPSLAVSALGYDRYLSDAARATRLLVRQILPHLTPSLLLNINIPPLPFDQLRGFRIAPLGKRIYSDVVVERKDPRGRPYYWIGGSPSWDPDENSDMTTVDAGYISVTPLHLNLTDAGALEAMSRWQLDLAGSAPD